MGAPLNSIDRPANDAERAEIPAIPIDVAGRSVVSTSTVKYLSLAVFALTLLDGAPARAQQAHPGYPPQPAGQGTYGQSHSGQVQYGQPGGYPPPGPAQQPGAYPGYGYPQGSFPVTPPPARVERQRADWEIGTLYGMSALYGVGMGLWLSAELRISDPGLYAIAPAVLGLAAPVGVYFLDRPKMDRGMPLAITTGMVLGTANGVGIVIYQHASQPDRDAWGYRQLTRAAAIGSTAGAIGGYVAGYYLEPPPESGLLVSSGTLWGSAIGAMFGYGASDAGKTYNQANESAALGGLIGLNVGAAAAGAMSVLTVPTIRQVGAMWLGAGIGAAISAPIYLFYIGDDRPPAKRGLIFSGTTTTLGLIAGAVFASGGSSGSARSESTSIARLGNFGELDYVAPMGVEGGVGLGLGGRLY